MSATDRQSDEISKKAFWRQHIEGYERSPLSQNQYCSKNGLALSTFSYWKRKIGTKAKATPRFYPLTVQQPLPPTARKSSSGLFLEVLKAGFAFKLQGIFFANALKKLLVTLEQL